MSNRPDIVMVVPDRTDRLYQTHPCGATSFCLPQFPLGAATLAAVLERNGFVVDIVDNYLFKLSLEALVERVLSPDPKVVGLSINTYNAPQGLALAKELKGRDPGLRIVAGGPHISLFAEELAGREGTINHFIQGEGELLLTHLMHELQKDSGRNIPRILKDPKPLDLTGLPHPAWHLTEFTRYHRAFEVTPEFTGVDMVASSRGCPYSCRFCSSSRLWGRRYRTRPAVEVVDEIETLMKQYGTRGIYFREDSFTCDRSHVQAVCTELRRRDLRIPWECESRVDNLDGELLDIMKSAGCLNIWFGLESGSDKVLQSIGKGFDSRAIRRAFTLCNERGINTMACVMLGFPWESLEDVQRSLDLLCELRPQRISPSVYVGMPDSPLYREMAELGFVEHEENHIRIVRNRFFEFRHLSVLEKQMSEHFYGVLRQPAARVPKLTDPRKFDCSKQRVLIWGTAPVASVKRLLGLVARVSIEVQVDLVLTREENSEHFSNEVDRIWIYRGLDSNGMISSIIRDDETLGEIEKREYDRVLIVSNNPRNKGYEVILTLSRPLSAQIEYFYPPYRLLEIGDGSHLGPRAKGYIDAAATISAATSACESVRDHLERIWGIPGSTQERTDRILKLVSLEKSAHYLEVGPGSGRYLDELIHRFPFLRAEIYETDAGWREWLGRSYPVVIRRCNGCTLQDTPNASIDFCAAHGVFVYLDPLVSFTYMAEMARCLRPGGWVVFNIIDADRPDLLALIGRHIGEKPGFFVPLSSRVVIDFMKNLGCSHQDSFAAPYDSEQSLYLLFVRNTPSFIPCLV